MKKTALALGSALMLFANTLNAQEQPWNFGVKAGMGASRPLGAKKLFPEEIEGTKMKFDYQASPRFGFTGGLTAGYNFNENVGMGLEVLYVGLGGTIKRTKELGADATEDAKKGNKPMVYHLYTDNIAIPLMLKWFPMGSDSEGGTLTVDLGIQGVMPLRTKLESKDETKGDDQKFEDVKDADGKELDKKKVFAGFTLNGIGGISYEFPGIGLTLEGRYHIGLMNSLRRGSEAKKYRKEKVGMKDDAKLLNQYVTVSLGYNLAKLLMK